ncbi:DUF7522 family protein [Halobaculum limi]|uniref:DUF7522 family protein n=1 Tax=Halobaculum limi TaxID=3031916 RepID=UPI0024065F12|nr:hypothetical protein [Halobaculum sp. YSMS11]
MQDREIPLDAANTDAIVTAARTGLGDDLRSVIGFTRDSFDVLYTRSDLYDETTDVRAVKRPLVELERVGFDEIPIRTSTGSGTTADAIGPYSFTVRFHERGFLARVIEDDVGVLLTTDELDVRAFEEAASAVRRLLRNA